MSEPACPTSRPTSLVSLAAPDGSIELREAGPSDEVELAALERLSAERGRAATLKQPTLPKGLTVRAVHDSDPEAVVTLQDVSRPWYYALS